MRIWDVPLECLCRKHLLAEHSELHACWSVIVNDKQGFAHHPEVARWRGKLRALYLRHEAQVRELEHRGYTHRTPLDERLATGASVQDEYVDTPEEQLMLLREKGCDCLVGSGAP